MVIKIKPKEAPPKYLFGKAARQHQATKATEDGKDAPAPSQPNPAAQPQKPAAPTVPVAEGTVTQRSMRRLQMTQPPNLPFLRFDAIAGKGGMAVVWRAWHKELKRNVAVKVMNQEFSSSGQDVRQFMMEVRTMTDMHHPGIVQGYGADCVDGRYYFIMDYVDGYTFGSLLHRKTRLPEIDTIIIGESVADAMSYAWNTFKIVHCDIKPENIMVDRDGTVKITDLGLCQSTAAIKTGPSEEVVGTPAYISPEQIYGDVVLDCRADIYSLGATLYHLTTGRMLFPGLSNDDILRSHVSPETQAPDPRRIVPTLSANLCNLLAGMLVKDRGMRYQTWEEVFDAFRAIETGGTVPPPPPEAIASIRLGV